MSQQKLQLVYERSTKSKYVYGDNNISDPLVRTIYFEKNGLNSLSQSSTPPSELHITIDVPESEE